MYIHTTLVKRYAGEGVWYEITCTVNLKFDDVDRFTWTSVASLSTADYVQSLVAIIISLWRVCSFLFFFCTWVTSTENSRLSAAPTLAIFLAHARLNKILAHTCVHMCVYMCVNNPDVPRCFTKWMGSIVLCLISNPRSALICHTSLHSSWNFSNRFSQT